MYWAGGGWDAQAADGISKGIAVGEFIVMGLALVNARYFKMRRAEEINENYY